MGFFSKKQEEGVTPKGTPGKIERITWNPKFSVRVDEVDAQHRELFAIMNRIADLHESGSQELLPVMNDLVRYVTEHFHTEIMVLMKAKYPGFRDHSREHDQFIEKVQEFLADFQKQDKQLTYRMLIYIRDWLLSHTQQVDMQYADFLVRTGQLAKVAP